MSLADPSLHGLGRVQSLLDGLEPLKRCGRVTSIVGTLVEVRGLTAPVGATCRIGSSRSSVAAEVVGFQGGRLQLLCLGSTQGVASGDTVELVAPRTVASVSSRLMGRVINALGEPIDGLGPIEVEGFRPLDANPPPPLSRPRIHEPLETGVRAIDTMLTLGKGQRIGLFAGSGVGKSTLLGMLAQHGRADVNVVGLVGERGREVLEFIERDLGPEGLKRSVVVVATSDQPAPLRVRAALLATALAEFFRDQGKDVCLMVDSLTRVALAQREIGLAVGEPPTTRGYTPSVFATIPRILERSGTAARGTITGLYTVLVEGDDLMEPVADLARSILDGHVVLTRKLADKGHFPAIDVLASVSRLMSSVCDADQQAVARVARQALAALESSRDLIDIGAYVPGTNPVLDYSLRVEQQLVEFLRQAPDQRVSLEEAFDALVALLRSGAEAGVPQGQQGQQGHQG